MEGTVAEVDKKMAAKEADAMAYAVALVIADNDTYTKADQFCVALKGLEKEIIADFADSKKAADIAHKTITAQEKSHLEKVIPPRNMVKQKMAVYQDAQEKLRREEEERQQAAAQKLADDAALEAAKQAEASGNHEEAEAIIQTPVVAVPVFIPRTIPKVATMMQKRWTFRVVNAALVPRQYLIVDEKALLKQAQATGKNLVVPGVEFFQKSV